MDSGLVESIKKLSISTNKNAQYCQMYLSQIEQELSKEDFLKFKKQLEEVDNRITLDKNLRPMKHLIVDIVRTFMISNKRIEVGDNFTNELLNECEDRDKSIRMLKDAVRNYNELCKSNNIQIPDYISKIIINSNVKTGESLRKRYTALKNNKSYEVKKFLESLPNNKLVQMDNNMMKLAAKSANENIRISKGEKNCVMKN